MNLRSVRIVTTDVPTSAGVFARLLGREASGYPEYMEVPTDGAVLAFCTPAGLAAATTALAGSAPGTQILEFEVDDLDEVRKELDDSVQMIQTPTVQPWGNRSMILRTADGTLVNFYTPVPDADRAWPSQN
ncbi:glyoxalase (plasmid) [Cryobacterium sp. LW097]|uniref:VOC family protein n=1 Tax=unclassified Cryobacterium TaxID=2649013 RepID=UPI000B4CA391|nr:MULTISPECIES: VOC family protein [unclassified Cryobacterium]ASD24256.1 glyoxalase [Cryobacterium sp. LW097]TFC52828.1 VOC family protein [Cryobacterium sp. TMB3-1-2]TFC62231.1 VOC family protein [Cryobacterium sp. TMB1-7]TFC70678.1 VOC family protein [Cryobacterium sp. TMB3-15]TFC75404.1 VOC family protein [Cryobacterium sp. TMB3-10]